MFARPGPKNPVNQRYEYRNLDATLRAVVRDECLLNVHLFCDGRDVMVFTVATHGLNQLFANA